MARLIVVLNHFIAAILMALCISPKASSDSKPNIQWFRTDMPPIFITSGTNKGQGYGDKTFKYFLDRMPEFDHLLNDAGLTRSLSDMKREDGICDAGILKTAERDEFIHFSNPVFYVLANQLVILKAQYQLFAPHINSEGKIDLLGLLYRDDLTAGLVTGRVYSERIGLELKKPGAAPKRVAMPHDRLGYLLAHGRTDYAFSYPAEARYQFGLQGQDDAYQTIPIEGEPTLAHGFIGCSDMSFGHKVIERVNEIIKEAGPTPPYWRYYEDWLNAAALETLLQARQ